MPAAAMVGAAVVGGIASNMAADKAADAQENAANQSNATQRYFYDTTRADNAPFREAGVNSVNKLQYLLGLNGPQTQSSVANRIRSSFPNWAGNANLSDGDLIANFQRFAPDVMDGTDLAGSPVTGAQIGEIQNILNSLRDSGGTPGQSDPAFGSLLRNFSADDLKNDPIYQSGLDFAMSEGTKGLNRMAAANGNALSGATLKALERFGAQTANQYGTDAFNRFNTNKQNTFNMLSGLSGAGQVATNQVSSAGQNAGNNISQSQMAAGNARGASAIAGANGLNNAISQGYNMYQQNQLMNRFLPQQYGVAQQPGVTNWVSQG